MAAPADPPITPNAIEKAALPKTDAPSLERTKAPSAYTTMLHNGLLSARFMPTPLWSGGTTMRVLFVSALFERVLPDRLSDTQFVPLNRIDWSQARLVEGVRELGTECQSQCQLLS
jgi:hypothetical protein